MNGNEETGVLNLFCQRQKKVDDTSMPSTSEKMKNIAFYFAVKLVREELPTAELPKYTPLNALV